MIFSPSKLPRIVFQFWQNLSFVNPLLILDDTLTNIVYFMRTTALRMIPLIRKIRTPSDKISITELQPSEHSISINGGSPRCSVVADKHVAKDQGTSGSRFSMEVTMNTKKLKTAIGLMEKGESFEYMRNDDIGEAFVR